MFVSAEDLKTFTGKTRPSAQARFLRSRMIAFVVRADGSIALRVEELDNHTLSRERRKKKEAEWEMPCLRAKRWEFPK